MMGKTLVKKVEFAKLAGVSQGRVTRLVCNELKAALVGRRIDMGHPDAVAYLQKRQAKRAGTFGQGLDPRYLEAVTMCTKSGVWSQGSIVKGLQVGIPRAKRIREAMLAAGVIPQGLAPAKPAPKPTPKAVSPTLKVVEPPPTLEIVAPPSMMTEPEIPDNIMEYADLTIRQIVNRFPTMTVFQDHLKAISVLEGINGKRLKNAQEAGVLVSRAVVETHIIGPMDAMLVQMLQDLPKTLSLQVANWISAGDDSLKIEKQIRELLTGFISPMKKKVERVVRKEMKGRRSA